MSTEVQIPMQYTRKNPFPAKMPVNRLLTLEGSEKETRHFEFSLEGSGITYEPGDSLAVFPSNDPAVVDEIIHALHASGAEIVPGNDGTPKVLRDALLTDYEIAEPSKQFIHAIVERGGEAASMLREMLDPMRKQELEAHLWGMHCIDFLIGHQSARFTPEEFVKLMRKLQPRLYSIASSLKAWPGQVHLTVALVRYESHGRKRGGVTTTFLADRVTENTRVPVFIHQAKGFRLPQEGSTPIIMVGPGTGVAPFRAFLQERKADGATGGNWLFFGEQREKYDFLYREEFEALKAEGVLTHFHTAFSRDQSQKVYVQNRLLENAAEVWKWLEAGAHFFVCGDAKRMAKDVDVALHTIIAQQGGKTPEQTAEYVEEMKKVKRYKRDVY